MSRRAKSETYACYAMDALMDCAKDCKRLDGDEGEVNKGCQPVRFSLIDDYIISRKNEDGHTDGRRQGNKTHNGIHQRHE